MQDMNSVGGGGRFFSGGGGDRRLRPHHHQNHQTLKCPRCDSLNTKFCYYNNYNLSQPRHFCKSCRRYWTKGGVLRNVPVGGGCRKTKRSKPRQTISTTETTPATTNNNNDNPITRPQQEQRERNSSNSLSSSESSSLTATNATSANGTVEAASAHSSSSASNNILNSASNNILNGMDESKLFAGANLNPSYESGLLEQGSDCGIFSEIGSFTSLITSTNEHAQLPFGFSGILNQQSLEQAQQNQNQHQQWQPKMVTMSAEEMKMQEITGGLIDQTGHVEFSALQNSRSGNGVFGSFDWQGTGDQGLFDLPSAVDQAYWNQSIQWTDQDHPSLYLP